MQNEERLGGMLDPCLFAICFHAGGGAAVLAHQLCGLISLASRADGMSLLLLRAYVLTAQFIRSSFGKVFQSVDYILNTLLSQNLCLSLRAVHGNHRKVRMRVAKDESVAVDRCLCKFPKDMSLWLWTHRPRARMVTRSTASRCGFLPASRYLRRSTVASRAFPVSWTAIL